MTMEQPTDEDIAEWNAWLKERPAAVYDVARRLMPWKLYRLASTGQTVFILAYVDDPDGVTLTVAVRNAFNPEVILERDVFGIKPDDLVELYQTQTPTAKG